MAIGKGTFMTTGANENEIPKDLKKITWLAKEYGFSYDEIYKASKVNHEIAVYGSGALKISLADFIAWVRKGLEPAKEVA